MKLFGLIFLVCCNTLCAQKIPNIKNVVVIIADDHAKHVTGTYGDKIIKTPSLDKLAAKGTRFNYAYCNSPICSASRQSLLTGKYPHATGVNLLFTPFPDEGNITIAEQLKKSGYATALVCKSHFNNWMQGGFYKDGLPKHGFDTLIQQQEYDKFLSTRQKIKVPDSLEYYDPHVARDNIAAWMNWKALPQAVFDAESSGTFYANAAIDFIDHHKEKPFFLWLAFFQPHHPYYFPLEYAGRYKANDMTLPQGSAEDDRWVPEIFKNLSDKERRGIIAAYYTATEYMDKNVGLVISALEKMKILDETLIVYLSDNGYLLNDHKRFEKHTMWQEATNQPMIIRIGKDFRTKQVSDALVEYIDVVPTILDLLGVEQIPGSQGKSFRSVFEGGSEFKDFAFSEYLEDNLAMITTKRWKYMFTSGRRDLGIGYKTGLGPPGVVHRLYNLENDPAETTNLAYQPAYRDTLQQLKNVMLQKFLSTHPDATKCPGSLTLDGKLAWFCEPRDVGTDQSYEDVPFRYFYPD